MNRVSSKITVAVSACLLGQHVRFDGNHKRQALLVDEFAELFEYLPLCPEVAIGLGVPRQPIRLVDDDGQIRVRGVNDASLDVTDKLRNYAHDLAAKIDKCRGFIFKKASPSCGMERVKIYRDRQLVSTRGVGAFAHAIMAAHPLLPVEEEGRLQDMALRENFIQRVLVYDRWLRLIEAGLTRGALVEFHSRHKFLLLAHDEVTYRALGRIVASVGDACLDDVARRYITLLMNGLKKPCSRRRHCNVLQHLMGFLKSSLDNDDKHELLTIIQQYREGNFSLEVPKTLLRHHFRRQPDPYVNKQFYLYQCG